MEMPVTTVYLFRHAEKMRLPHTGNENYDRIQPLTARGEEAAISLLKVGELRHADAAYCSPYARTVATLRYLKDADGLSLILDDRLREWDFGGRPPMLPPEKGGTRPERPERPESDPRSRQWENPDLAYEGGETLNQCAARMDRVLREIVGTNSGKKILVGTHGHIICAFLSAYLEEIDFPYARTLPQPSVFRLLYDGTELTDVERLQLPGQEAQKKKAKPRKKVSRKAKTSRAMQIMLRHSRDFGGELTDRECIKLAEISEHTFYKYKKALREDPSIVEDDPDQISMFDPK